MVVSTPVLLGGAAVLAGGAYLLSKKSSGESKPMTTEEVAATVAANNAKVVTGASEEAAQNVTMDASTEEYNVARERYRMVAGAYPPRSWSLEMINSWIEEQSKKEELLKHYVSLVAANSSYTTRENTDELTYQQLQALIDKTNNEIASNKEKERVKSLADTAKSLASKFRATLQAPNYFNLTLKGQNAWDTATLSAMKALSKEGKQYCEYYFEQGGAVKLPGYFNQIKSAWKEYKSIASCILDSNTNTGRTGASLAKEVKAAFQGIAAVAPKVGADGSLMVRAKSKGRVNPLIAFHLSEL